MTIAALLTVLLALTPIARAEVTPRALWSTSTVAPGDQCVLAVVFDIEPGWHINPREEDLSPAVDFAIPTEISLDVSPGSLRFGPIQWPEVHEVEVAYTESDGLVPAYVDRAIAYVPVIVPVDAAEGGVPISIEVSWQACNDVTCAMPRSETLWPSLTVQVSPPASPEPDTDIFGGFDSSVFAEMSSGSTARASEEVSFDVFGWSFALDVSSTWGLVLLLLTAALGGFLLNFTPCVLPVIPLKIMSLSRMAENRARCLALGITMSLGIVAFWLALGLAVASLAGFTAANQLFQYPGFTIGVGVVIAVMAVGMCGLFTIPLPQKVYAFNPKQDSHSGSFGFGVMTAILSTPCTAPFMGAAAAWSATQPATVTLGTFASIGAGMAMPYAVLASMPGWLSHLPRAGPASALIKQLMGLLMLSAAAYFVGVGLSGALTTPPSPPSRLYWWPVMGLVAAAGGWMAWRTWRLTSRVGPRLGWGLLGVLLVFGAVQGAARLSSHGPIDWLYYTPARFEQFLSEGNVVVVDFTAEWCLNCKALEEAVLFDDDIVALLDEDGVAAVKVDLTGNNEVGNAFLKDTGRLTIPLLVVYAADGREVFMSDAYTVDQVTSAIAAARSP